MKKILSVGYFLAPALLGLFFFTGCKKGQTDSLTALEEEQVILQSSESEIESQTAFGDVLDNVMGVNSELGMGGSGIFGRVSASSRTVGIDSMPSCVRISITPQQANVFPKTVVMDFGTGCRSHGHLRSGKITTVYTGRLIEPGKSATTTFENYKIDSTSVEGAHKVTNTSTPGANQRQFTIEVTNGKLTRTSGSYEEWSSLRVHTQIEGNGTVMPADDVFRITGGSKGKTKRGNLQMAWTSEIQEPLIKKFTCRWLSKGIIKTIREGLPSNTQWIGLLHFGDGTCDNKATLTANGNVREITLR